MGRLAEVSLSELVEIAVGGLWGSEIRTEKENTPVRVIRGVDAYRMSQREFVNLPTRWVSANQLASRTLGIGDIVLEASGACGRSYVVRKTDINGDQLPLSFSNFSRRLIPNSKVDPTYLGYRLKQAYESDELASYVTGTAMPNLDVRSALTGLSIFLPPLPEQREIARILGTLDDKIELNHRMIVTLEAMARALFQSWFVDFDPVRAKAEGRQPVGIETETAELFPDSFEDSALGSIPKGWKPRNIASFIDFTVNGDWGSNDSALGAETAAYCVRGADIPALRRGHCDTLPTRYISDKSLIKRMISDGDLVIEISGGSPTQSTGRVVYMSSSLLERVLKPVICSNFCRIIRPMKRSHGILVYGWLDHLYQKGVLFQFETGTTGIKNLSYKNVFTENMLAFPGDDLIQKFVQSVSHLHSQLVHVAGEVERIRVLRDTLLPKLLSGELRVGDVAA